MEKPFQPDHNPTYIHQTILVVEDENSVLENIVELLEAEGFQTLQARNGEEAYRLIPEVRPDLIISDVRMPRLDGRGLLSRLSQTPDYQNIPFIFLTALTDRADLRAGMELGADDYITKPFTRKDLLGAVSRRLQKHKRIQAEAIQGAVNSQMNLTQAIPYEMLQPLTQILSKAGQLEQMCTAPNGEDIYQAAHAIRTATETLMRNVSTYLLLNEISTPVGKSSSEKEEEPAALQLKPVVTELVQSIGWEYGRSEDLHLDLPEGLVAIREDILTRIVEELTRYALVNSHPGQRLDFSGLEQIDIGFYRLSILAPKGGLWSEQITLIENADRLPLSDYMRVGMGLVLAWNLVRASGSQIHFSSQPDEMIQVVLSVPLIARPISTERHYV